MKEKYIIKTFFRKSMKELLQNALDLKNISVLGEM